MQAEGPVVPELDADRGDAVAGPIGWARHLADGVFGRVNGDRLLEGEAAFEWPGLLARPGTDAAVTGTAGEIGIRLGVADRRDGAAGPDLPAQALPMEDERRLRVRRQLA